MRGFCSPGLDTDTDSEDDDDDIFFAPFPAAVRVLFRALFRALFRNDVPNHARLWNTGSKSREGEEEEEAFRVAFSRSFRSAPRLDDGGLRLLRMLRSLWRGSGRSRLLLRRWRGRWGVFLWVLVGLVVVVMVVLVVVHMVEVRAYSWVSGG